VWSVKTRELDTPLSLAPPVDDWIKTGCCTRRETPKGFDPLRLMPESRQALSVSGQSLAFFSSCLVEEDKKDKKGRIPGPTNWAVVSTRGLS
jgi:hypothetical protein